MNEKKYKIIVELDPPVNADATGFLAAAGELKNAGAELITVSDSPSAKARMDSCMLACRVRREIGVETLPHLTCRDRNSIAMKALLMGIYSEGIRNVLVVTGDPFGQEQKSRYYKSVFEHNSRTMTRGIHALVGSAFPEPFNIYGALNVNAVNFDYELSKAEDKISVGMCGLLTQPVFSDRALDNLKKAKETLGCAIYGGVMPIVSERNAVFMNENVPGISIPDEITRQYHGKSKEESTELAIKISRSFAADIRSTADGIYVITPFLRTDIVKEVIKE